MNKILVSLFIILSSISSAQTDTLKVLFLGNSYTSVYNLPLLVKNLSTANNQVLITDFNTPGGCTLEQHSTNETSLQKIRKGNWDFVVLQEQSQIPTIEYHKENSMYPAARRLNDSIKKYNSCATTLFYMTWGRRFGGQQCDNTGINCSPDFVDFTHMQDSLESAYWGITNELNAQIAPVGIAWKKAITINDIILHATDDSHPNYSGAYLSACVFYSMIWDENSFENSFIGNLEQEIAHLLQSNADSIIFHTANDWNRNINKVKSHFSFDVFNDSVQFSNLSECLFPMQYQWTFGDGNHSNNTNPGHTYSENNTYEVNLISNFCTNSDTSTNEVLIDVNIGTPEYQAELGVHLSPNPVQSELDISFDQLFSGQIDLINESGEIVFTHKTEHENQILIPTNHFKSGIYFVRINDNNLSQASTFKILKI